MLAHCIVGMKYVTVCLLKASIALGSSVSPEHYCAQLLQTFRNKQLQSKVCPPSETYHEVDSKLKQPTCMTVAPK